MLSHNLSTIKRLLPWVVCLLVWLFFWHTLAESDNQLESSYYDLVFSYTPDKQPTNNNIVVIGVDQESLNHIGPWPWPRRYHGYLLEHLGAAKAVGLDIIFTDPDIVYPDSDEYLAKAIMHNNKVAIATLNHSAQTNSELLPLLRRSAKAIGYVNFSPDSDGVLRRLKSSQETTTYSLSHKPQLSFPAALLQAGQIKIVEKNYTLRSWLSTAHNSWLIPYSHDEERFPLLSYDQILKLEVPSNYFKDKIVLVGATAASMQDRQITPSQAFSGDLSGVLVLANMTNALLNDDLVLVPDRSVQLAFAIIVLILLISLIFFTKKNNLLIYFAFCFGLVVIHFWIYYWARVWLPVTNLVACILSIGFIDKLMRMASFQAMAFTDGLTGLSNRYAFEIALDKVSEKSYKQQFSTAFLLIDLDFFKSYNDTYGHDLGDEVLRNIGTLLSQQRRKGEIAARLGGEEFAVVIPRCQLAEGYNRAEAIRQAVLDLAIVHETNRAKLVSVSIGVCVGIMSPHKHRRSHYQEADIALYSAKRKGRNSVEIRAV